MAYLNENEEKALLLEIAVGNEKAFSQIFHLYKDKLYSFILRISGSGQMAEDIVQDIFLKIWQNRSDAANIRQFDAYLFRMARNQALNGFKRAAKESFILAEMGQQASESETGPCLEFKEMERSVKEAVGKLPNKQKQVFVLSREYGLKQAEISQLLNITVPTVKSHITQAVHTIRKECKSIHSLIKVLVILFSALLH